MNQLPGDSVIETIMTWQAAEPGEKSYEIMNKIDLEQVRKSLENSGFDVDKLAESIWQVCAHAEDILETFRQYEAGKKNWQDTPRAVADLLDGIIDGKNPRLNSLQIVIDAKNSNLLSDEGKIWLDEAMQNIHEIVENFLFPEGSITRKFQDMYQKYKQAEG